MKYAIFYGPDTIEGVENAIGTGLAHNLKIVMGEYASDMGNHELLKPFMSFVAPKTSYTV